MKKINNLFLLTLISIFLSACGGPDWKQCPKPVDISLLSTNNINNKNELKIFVSSIVAAFIPPKIESYREDPRYTGGNQVMIPISMQPNQNCDGLLTETIMTGTSEIDSRTLWAMRELFKDTGAQEDTICSEPRMGWMRDLGYTTREILKTEKNQIIYDFTYDFESCSEFHK